MESLHARSLLGAPSWCRIYWRRTVGPYSDRFRNRLGGWIWRWRCRTVYVKETAPFSLQW